MKRIFGADKVKFSKLERTPEGFLKGELAIARTGVYEYYQDGKSVRKVKMPDDLFSEKNINSLRGAPVTDGHPIDANGQPVEVNSSNYQKYAKGNVSEPRVVGNKIKAQGIIFDGDLADEVEAGEKIELSGGFMFLEDSRSGEYDGEAYDAAQRDIVSNHVAVVKAGRAGPGCSFNIDMKEDGMTVKWRTRDEKEVEIAGDNANVIHGELTHYKAAAADAEGKLETATEDVKTLDEKVKKLTSDLEEAKKSTPAVDGDEKDEQIKKLTKDIKDLNDKLELAADEKKTLEADVAEAKSEKPKVIEQMVADRVDLLEKAGAFGIDDCSGLDTRQVMEQVIQVSDLAYEEGVKVGDKSDDAIRDRFEAAVDRKRVEMNSDKGPEGGRKSAVDVQAEVDEKKAGRKNLQVRGKTEKGGK